MLILPVVLETSLGRWWQDTTLIYMHWSCILNSFFSNGMVQGWHHCLRHCCRSMEEDAGRRCGRKQLKAGQDRWWRKPVLCSWQCCSAPLENKLSFTYKSSASAMSPRRRPTTAELTKSGLDWPTQGQAFPTSLGRCSSEELSTSISHTKQFWVESSVSWRLYPLVELFLPQTMSA